MRGTEIILFNKLWGLFLIVNCGLLIVDGESSGTRIIFSRKLAKGKNSISKNTLIIEFLALQQFTNINYLEE